MRDSPKSGTFPIGNAAYQPKIMVADICSGGVLPARKELIRDYSITEQTIANNYTITHYPSCHFNHLDEGIVSDSCQNNRHDQQMTTFVPLSDHFPTINRAGPIKN